MTTRDIIVIGASAGGIEPLRAIVSRLPADLQASVLVVLHMSPSGRSVLPEILGRVTSLRVVPARDGESLERGTIYVAPPDRHLLLHGTRIRLSRRARENGHRPAVDPLFRSAARWFGPRCISVVLSGALDDGTSGTLAVKLGEGMTVAQLPEDALYASMPDSAIRVAGVDHVRPADAIGPLLAALTRETITVHEEIMPITSPDTEDEDGVEDPGTPPEGPASSFTCPECHGALWELRDEKLVRYRYRVGHAYAPETLAAHQASHVEDALWAAYRALQESAALAARLGERATASGMADAARRYADKRNDAEAKAKAIRVVLDQSATGPNGPPVDADMDDTRLGKA